MKAFLSHSSADNALATRLFRFMRDQAVDVWFDRVELRPGDSLLGEIGAGIESADFLLALLTEKSVASPWVQKELTIALNREISGKKPRVIPLVVEPCPVPTIVSDKLYLSIRSNQADFPDLIPALFRDSFILDLPLSPELTLNRESLRSELYEFTRSRFLSLQARIDNHGFNERVKEICMRTVAEVSQGQDPHKESVVRQIKGISDDFDLHLPLFWTNLAGSLSILCQVIFKKFGKNLAALDFAVPGVANTIGFALYNLGRRLRSAIFSSFAEKFGEREIAVWISKIDQYASPEEFVARLASSGSAEAMVDVELVGDKQRRVTDTRFQLPSSEIDLQVLAFGASPATEIFDTTWYEVCVPQIIVRNLTWTVYGLGKPLHELDYTLGLTPEDYTRMGLA